MTRFTPAPEHKKFFQLNGYITFDALVDPLWLQKLFAAIEKRRSELPGVTQQNLANAFPDILKLAGKMGALATLLIEKKPLRLAQEAYIESPSDLEELNDREVGLLLSETGSGTFYTSPSHLYNEPQACYLLLIFTPNYVNKPIVVK